jgi:hypothetical protein
MLLQFTIVCESVRAQSQVHLHHNQASALATVDDALLQCAAAIAL